MGALAFRCRKMLYAKGRVEALTREVKRDPLEVMVQDPAGAAVGVHERMDELEIMTGLGHRPGQGRQPSQKAFGRIRARK